MRTPKIAFAFERLDESVAEDYQALSVHQEVREVPLAFYVTRWAENETRVYFAFQERQDLRSVGRVQLVFSMSIGSSNGASCFRFKQYHFGDRDGESGFSTV
ncbi:MAG: hypothetical protein JNL67_02960 [Planctomycetaceae bacterium]|nr:hypothetical protein [Planctomycetaceae bacterium]